MTAAQFRGSAAWKRARRIASLRATVCAICGGAFRRDLGHLHPLAPSVDHVSELATLDLDTVVGREAAVDQANLRVVHFGCNASRGARLGLQLRYGGVRLPARTRSEAVW